MGLNEVKLLIKIRGFPPEATDAPREHNTLSGNKNFQGRTFFKESN
jgi:hypothetical protein